MKMREFALPLEKSADSWKAGAAAGLVFIAACATSNDDAILDVAEPDAPAAPVFVLSDILGAVPDALEARLGAPALTRREGDGEFRRYSLSTCMLIVILYPDDTGAPRAAHVDAVALNSEEEKPALDACLAAG